MAGPTGARARWRAAQDSCVDSSDAPLIDEPEREFSLDGEPFRGQARSTASPWTDRSGRSCLSAPQIAGPGEKTREEGLLAIEALRRDLVLRIADATQCSYRFVSSGLPEIDALCGGGFPRGRLAEVTGPTSSGRTALLLATAAAVTARGEVVAWIDPGSALDVRAAEAAGVSLPYLLWVRPKATPLAFIAADIVLGTGGFTLVVIDVSGSFVSPQKSEKKHVLSQVCARLSRGAERCGAAVVLLAESHLAGTFAALTLDLAPAERAWRGPSPRHAVLVGTLARCRVARNKLGPPEKTAVIGFGEILR